MTVHARISAAPGAGKDTMKMIKRTTKRTTALVAALAIVAALILSLGACGKDDKVYAEMKVKGYGTIVLELEPSVAPITVQNFVDLANEGFYDGLTFHRVIEDFMIQGGDPKANGTGGSANTIKGEFSENGVTNKISHVRGVISMARSSDMNSASSQFFICNADATYLDGQYAAFGRVIEGMEVVDAITAGTLPFTPYYEYYGTTTYDMLKAYGYLSGVIEEKANQAIIESVRIVER